MDISISTFCKIQNIEAEGRKKVVKPHKKPEYLKIEVREDLIPAGAKLVECYLTEREVVVCGEPDDESHNCDAMGCGTFSHVIYRFERRQRGATKTWTDQKTGLEWKLESPRRMTWQQAMDYAETLGDNWRLPTIEELETLVDRSKYGSPMRKEVPFKDFLVYWSSTTYEGDAYNTNYEYNTNYALGVDYYYGCVDYYYKTSSFYVRCVRG